MDGWRGLGWQSLKTALDETDLETDRDRDAQVWFHLDGSVKLDHWGDQQREKKSRGSDLAQAGLCDGMLYDPVYHALKGGHAGSFEVPDHPAGSLQTCGRWTFMLLAEVIQYLSHLLMCVFWGRDSKKHFYASQSSHEKSSLSGWLALWCFDVGVPLRILSRKK